MLLKELKNKIKEYDCFDNCKYGAIVDWRESGRNHRFYLYDLKGEKLLYSWYTSHGKASGSPLKASTFSNIPNTHKSSYGMLRVAEPYQSSKFEFACRLDGLDRGINDNVRKRAIVMHSSDYCGKDWVRKYGYAGRSHGCITMDPDKAPYIIDCLKHGSPLYLIK